MKNATPKEDHGTPSLHCIYAVVSLHCLVVFFFIETFHSCEPTTQEYRLPSRKCVILNMVFRLIHSFAIEVKLEMNH